MRRRVLASGVGGLTAAGLVTAAIQVLSPPPNLLVAVALLAVVVPVTAAGGAALGLAAAGLGHRASTARLAAIGAPVLTIMLLFTVDLAITSPDSRGTQIASFVLGSGCAAALAARFSDGA